MAISVEILDNSTVHAISRRITSKENIVSSKDTQNPFRNENLMAEVAIERKKIPFISAPWQCQADTYGRGGDWRYWSAVYLAHLLKKSIRVVANGYNLDQCEK